MSWFDNPNIHLALIAGGCLLVLIGFLFWLIGIKVDQTKAFMVETDDGIQYVLGTKDSDGKRTIKCLNRYLHFQIALSIRSISGGRSIVEDKVIKGWILQIDYPSGTSRLAIQTGKIVRIKKVK